MENNEIIKNIFLGNVGNCDCIPQSREYEEAENCFDKLDKEFRELLKDKSELLDKYNQISTTLVDMLEQTEIDHFVEGFRFGFLLALDVLNYQT